MHFQDMNELLGITPTPVLEPLTYQRLFIGYLFLNERNSLIDLFLFNFSLGFILLRYKIFFPLGMVRLPYPFQRVPTMRLKDSVSVSTNWRTSLIRYRLELRHSWCQLILFLYIIGFSYSLIYFLYIPYFIILLPYFISFFFSFFQYKTFIYIKNWFGARIAA